jgi:hypothetical protein
MRAMKSLVRLAAVVLHAAAFGCAGAADIPDVPELDALQQAYDEPSATLDARGARELLLTVPELERLAAAFSSAGPLLDRIEDARQSARKRASPTLALRGSMTLTVPCPGQLDQAEYDAAVNGDVSLELAVEGSRIKPTFWAIARHCVLRGVLTSGPVAVEIDGEFGFDVGSAISLEQAWARGATLALAVGTMSFEDVSIGGGVSARFDQGRFEYSRDVTDGTVVLLVTDDGLGVRDREGTWFCGREVARCARR